LGLSFVGFVTGFLDAVQGVLGAEVGAIYGRVYIVALVVHGGETIKLYGLAMHHANTWELG